MKWASALMLKFGRIWPGKWQDAVSLFLPAGAGKKFSLAVAKVFLLDAKRLGVFIHQRSG